MTIDHITPVAKYAYTGPGRYDFSYKLNEEAHLIVTHLSPDGTPSILTRDDDYSVTINPLPAIGGHIDVTTPVVMTGTIELLRALPTEQRIPWAAEGFLNLDLLEKSLDEIVMILQQFAVDISDVNLVVDWRGVWTGPLIEYKMKSLVVASTGGPISNLYQAVNSHTSTASFSADLAAGRWVKVLDLELLATTIRDTVLPDPTTGQPEQAVIVNPTGTGYVLGDGAGGLKWLPFSTSQTAAKGKGYMMDTSLGILTVTPPATPAVGDSFGVADWKDTFHLNKCTIAFTGIKVHGVVQTDDMTLDVKGQKAVFAWSGADQGWIITDLVPTGAAWEYMPYAVMRVQDQKTSGTAGGTSTTGLQDRTLNTVVQNDIAGASLAGNQITLPPGEYEAHITALGYADVNNQQALYLTDSSNNSLFPTLNGPSACTPGVLVVSGKFTLAVQTNVKLRYYCSTGVATTGLGKAISQGTEVYADLKITKIGGNYAPMPVISAARLQPMAGVVPNCQVQGFEITNTGANQLTVTKGQCLASDLATPIAVTGNTVLALDATPNKLFTIAAVILNNGAHTCKAYNDEAAMAADVGVNITHFAYIGWWQNNGSGAAKAGRLFGVGDGSAELWWSKSSENVLFSATTVPGNCSTAVNMTSVLPDSSRVKCVQVGGQSTTGGQNITLGYDGTNVATRFATWNTNTGDNDGNTWSGSPLSFMPIVASTIYWGRGTIAAASASDLRLQAVSFRR